MCVEKRGGFADQPRLREAAACMPRMTHPNPGGLSRPLLVAAQTLFMLLPLIGLWLMREGKPMRLTPTKCLAVGAAIVAVSLLVAMFYDTEIGVPN